MVPLVPHFDYREHCIHELHHCRRQWELWELHGEEGTTYLQGEAGDDQECEDLMPECFFTKKNWFPRFIIIRREQGSSAGGDNSDEWNGFVKQMKKHLEHETNKLNEIFIQNINRSTESTKKEMKTYQEEIKNARNEDGQEEMKKTFPRRR
jgi:hypothetical protein